MENDKKKRRQKYIRDYFDKHNIEPPYKFNKGTCFIKFKDPP